VEVSAQYNVLPTLVTLKASYTFLNAKDETTGLELLRRPNHAARISVAYTPTRELTIEPIIRLIGKRADAFFNDATFTTDRVTLKPYARFDLVADYKVNKTVSVFARGENLTNVRYEDIYNYGTAGRSVYAGVQMTW
jgi:vitamin B12 transporter